MGLAVTAVLFLTDGSGDPLVSGSAVDACELSGDVCNMTAAIHNAILVDRDYEWVVQTYKPPGFIVCNPDAAHAYFGVGPPEPCEGAGKNETRYVYSVGDGGLFLAEAFKQVLGDWVEMAPAKAGDEFGPAGHRLYSIGCKDSPGRLDCSDHIILVFSKIPEGNGARSHLVLFISRGTELTLSAFIGPLPEERHVGPALKGGETSGFFGPAARPVTFYPLN